MTLLRPTECKQCPLGKFSGGFGSASCPACEQQPCMCDFLALEKNKKFVAVDQPDANLKILKCHLWCVFPLACAHTRLPAAPIRC